MSQPVFIDNGAWLHPLGPRSAAKPLRILAVGSSSTAGIGASSPAFAYPAQLRLDLATIWDIGAEVENAGVGGEQAPATVGRLKALLQTRHPDLVLWQVGTNDANGGEPEDVFRALVEDGIDAVRSAKIDLVLLDPQFYPGIKNVVRYEHFVHIIEEVARRDHVPLFSRYALMRAWSERSDGAQLGMLSKDGLHMSDRGYACLAQRLASDMAQRWGRLLQLGGKGAGAPDRLSAPAQRDPAAGAHASASDAARSG